MGTARYDESRAVVAATRQATQSAQDASEVYNWFTEGFDTKDLQGAETLIEELRDRAIRSLIDKKILTHFDS